MILFVCTGNTCRSPLAEGLCKQILAQHLGCDPASLQGRGYQVHSAGVAAMPGDPAAGPAIDVARDFGVDLSQHRSQLVNPELLATATHVVTMTQAHTMALSFRYPGLGPQTIPLCGTQGDLPDPIGGSREQYQECADAIVHHLRRLLTMWV
ncbi:MAG: hypothetical protein LC104_10500 [Bacteroidales bacterium]|nr:hypothetical protein [Bacteroidales bacterium]